MAHHVRGRHTARALSRLGARCAILATNRSWTSLAQVDDVELDAGSMSRELDVSVVQLWFDDDHGMVTLRFFAPDAWTAELATDGSPVRRTLSRHDAVLLDELVRRRIITATRVVGLREVLQRPTLSDGLLGLPVEVASAFYFPSSKVLPVPCSRELLQELAPDAQLVEGQRSSKRRGGRKADAPRALAPDVSAVAKSEDFRRVLELHQFYWANIFQMNDWTVYKEYKRHLPAERRHEVDRLCDYIANGQERELSRAVENIFATVWGAADWDALIRDPLRTKWDEPFPDVLEAWHTLLEARRS